MINDLKGLNIEEIKTAIEFHEKINNGKCNYLNICESYECDVCPIGRQIEDGMDCEEVYNLIRYKDLITEELVEDIQKKKWEYCNMQCETCKLQNVWLGKDDCNIFIEGVLDFIKIETDEEIKEKTDKELLNARIKTIEKKVDMILQILIEKNN